MLDIVIKDGKIVNGTGNPWYYGDVGIKDGLIVSIGKIEVQAKEVLDASGKIVTPGFIDVHSHSDLKILQDPLGEIKLQQGVTTEIFGNCGFSPAPLNNSTAELLKSYSQPVMGELNRPWSWNSFKEYMDVLSQGTYSHNIGTYVGNGALRIAIKGFDSSPLTKKELNDVKALLADAMEAGALGLSLGLMYAPENYYSIQELVDICSILSQYNGLLVAHIRGEGNSLISSIEEVIYIAQENGIPLHISHFKAAGRNNWDHKVDKAMDLIESARARGVDVTCDVYPYNAGSTSLWTLLPPWVLEGGVESGLDHIKNPRTRQAIYDELSSQATSWDNLIYSTGWGNVVISSVASRQNQKLVGKNVDQISQERGRHPIDCVFDLLLEEKGKISIVFFHTSEEDVKKILVWDKSLVVSDSLFSAGGVPHPRLYGTFPRLFAKYVRHEKLITLEEAVRKVTSFPAQRLNLNKIGVLDIGYIADIVVFDMEEIEDRATYLNPRQYPKGINWVIVNGRKVMEEGRHLGVKSGRVLKRAM
ncbi:MAG: D-aminoacylase [Caldicoprobacterales bacterium]|jgi:N-acyl-D-amino-acid deacylase